MGKVVCPALPAPGVGLHVESAAFRGEKRLRCAALSGQLLQDELTAQVSYIISATAKPNTFQIYDAV